MILKGVNMKIHVLLWITLGCIYVHCQTLWNWSNSTTPPYHQPLAHRSSLTTQPTHRSQPSGSVSTSSMPVSAHLTPPGQCECVNETKLEDKIVNTGETVIENIVERIFNYFKNFFWGNAGINEYNFPKLGVDIKEIMKKLDEIYKKLCQITEEDDENEIPWKQIENLIIADCVETAFWSLDGWFRNKEWRTMPMDVRKVLIALSCKMGWRNLLKLNTFRRLLKKGKWEDAAKELLKQPWSKNNKEIADKIADKLKAVPE